MTSSAAATRSPARTPPSGAGRSRSSIAVLGEAAGEAPPGEVTSVSPDEIAVALAGGSLRVHRVQPKGSPKQKAPEFLAASGIKAGERFGA